MSKYCIRLNKIHKFPRHVNHNSQKARNHPESNRKPQNEIQPIQEFRQMEKASKMLYIYINSLNRIEEMKGKEKNGVSH